MTGNSGTLWAKPSMSALTLLRHWLCRASIFF
jgi:hypothetical protein